MLSTILESTINGVVAGLLDPEPHPSLHPQGPEITWRQLVCTLLGLEDSNIFYDNLTNNISERTGSDYAVDVLEELGLLGETVVTKCGSPLDTLTQYLSLKLALGLVTSLKTFTYLSSWNCR